VIQDGVIHLKMNQQEFAYQVGGIRQSINAALRGFQRRDGSTSAAGP
jgi:hypothetical protein